MPLQIPQEGDVLLRHRLVCTDGDEGRHGPREPLHRHLRVVAEGTSQAGRVEEPGAGIPAERRKVHRHPVDALAVLRVSLLRYEVGEFLDADDCLPPVREPHAHLFPFREGEDGKDGSHGDRSDGQDVPLHDAVQEGALPRLESPQHGDVDGPVPPGTLPACLDLRVEALQTVAVPDLDEPLQEPLRIFLPHHYPARHDPNYAPSSSCRYRTNEDAPREIPGGIVSSSQRPRPGRASSLRGQGSSARAGG